MAGTPAADGIINPPIDELLDVVDSKYRLVIMAAKRARQINAYYSPARRGPARVRRPARRDARPGEAAVDRAARDQRNGCSRRSKPRAEPPGAPPWPRVVLGVGAGIAAYKACRAAAPAHRGGPPRAGRADPRRAALRRRADLGGAVRPAGRDRRLDRRRTRSRTSGSGRTPTWSLVAPATADLLARAAAGTGRDLLTATLLTARCPVMYAPAMHTEMWEHPATQAQRGHAARPRRAGRRARLRPPDRRGHRPGRLPEPAELFALARIGAFSPTDAAGAAAPFRPGRPAGGGLGRRDPRGTRSGPLPRQLVDRAGRATRSRGPRRPAAREVTLVAANVELPDPAGRRGHPRRLRQRPARRDARRGGRRRRRGDGRRRRRLPARAARSGQKIKKDGPAPRARPDRADRKSRHPRGAGRPPGGARPGGPGASSGSRPRPTTCWPTAAQAKLAAQGMRPARGQPGGRRAGVRRRRQRGRSARRRRWPDADPARSKDALASVVWDLVAARLG